MDIGAVVPGKGGKGGGMGKSSGKGGPQRQLPPVGQRALAPQVSGGYPRGTAPQGGGGSPWRGGPPTRPGHLPAQWSRPRS
eukprot:16449389-Heterocapsa_arctica.AAC.1